MTDRDTINAIYNLLREHLKKGEEVGEYVPPFTPSSKRDEVLAMAGTGDTGDIGRIIYTYTTKKL